MKYAFMSSSCPDLTLGEMVAMADRFGYVGIEPRVMWQHKHGVEFEADQALRKQIKQQVDDSGITMCCIATGCKYADPAEADKQIDDTKRAIELAADVGCQRIRVFGGMLPDGMSRDDAIEQVAMSLLKVADDAKRRGVTICFETHDDWCDVHHVAAVMKRVNHAAVAVNWDIMHPVRAAGQTMDEAFKALGPWVRHVHIHDGQTVDGELEMLPIGQGIIDHRRALALLVEMKYDGFISGEWIQWEPAETHLPRELAAMRAIEAQVVR